MLMYAYCAAMMLIIYLLQSNAVYIAAHAVTLSNSFNQAFKPTWKKKSLNLSNLFQPNYHGPVAMSMQETLLPFRASPHELMQVAELEQ
ncbi:hypothetical protein IW262DRAFT_682552 [Armillaria fumosa]|nr:hypothetical protein IW262DRAFT_682552 [Armillaria fumosa]